VLQNYYSHLPGFAGSRYISVVGTVAFGLGYLGAPVIIPLVQSHPQQRRQMILIGCMLSLPVTVLTKRYIDYL
jgi:hypothetical protein